MYRRYPQFGAASWREPVANPGELPTDGNQVGDVRLSESTGEIYYWTGAMWMVVAGAAPTPTFAIIQPDQGTAPTASGVDTLTIQGTGGLVTTGDALTDTITIGPAVPTKTQFFAPNSANNNNNNYRGRTRGTTQPWTFTGIVPADFNSIVAVEMLIKNQSASQAAEVFDVSSSYAFPGEDGNTNNENALTAVVDFTGTNNQLFAVDISGAFTGVQPRHIFGVTFQPTITVQGTISLLGIRFEYV